MNLGDDVSVTGGNPLGRDLDYVASDIRGVGERLAAVYERRERALGVL